MGGCLSSELTMDEGPVKMEEDPQKKMGDPQEDGVWDKDVEIAFQVYCACDGATVPPVMSGLRAMRTVR